MNTTLTDEQLHSALEVWVKKLCDTGGKAWTLRVPVDFNHDPDMLILELIKRHKEISTPLEEGKHSDKPDLHSMYNVAWNMEIKEGRSEDIGYIPAMFRFGFDAGFKALQSEVERLKAGGWISVKERLPEYMQVCIIHSELGFVTQAQFGGGKKPVFSIGEDWHIADYWMPLPLPPNYKLAAQEPVKSAEEQLKQTLYDFRDMFCQNVDISAIDEYVEEKTANQFKPKKA